MNNENENKEDKGKLTPRSWQRVDAVISLLLENDRYLQNKREKGLIALVMEKFDIKRRRAIQYIQEARREINRIGKTAREKALVKAIRDREYLLQVAKSGVKDSNKNYVVKPNHKLALEIMKDVGEINGLYVQKIEHSGKISLEKFNLAALTDEQLSIVEGMVKRSEDPRPYLTALGIYVANLD